MVNLAIMCLILVSGTHSQFNRLQNPDIDDLMSAIAMAALNGGMPLHQLGLGRPLANPNRKGDVLRIPIVLIRPNDFKRKKSKKWNNKNRQSEKWRGLPDKKPIANKDIDNVDEKSGDQSPAPKPVLKVPAISGQVSGAVSPLENSFKPTIETRYLKAVTNIPSTSDSSPVKYESTREVYNGQFSGQYIDPISKYQSLSGLALMAPPEEQSLSFRNEPVIVHKSINVGNVYRKVNSEEPEEELSSPVEESDGPVIGYAKDQYDKQLMGTLTKLIANSKNRASPMNFGGLGGSEAVQSIKPVTKTTKNYYTSLASGESSQTKSDSHLSRNPSVFSSSSQTSQNPVSKSSKPYTLQSQSSSQSKIPEYLLGPLETTSSARPVKTVSDYLTPINRGEQQPLQPGQVPLLPEVNRRPVSLDLGFDSGTRPLSAYSVFNAAEE